MGKKWSLLRHWRQASNLKRVTWVGGVILFLATLGSFAAYIWGDLLTKWNFEADHTPHVVFSRAPDLIGQLSCSVAPHGWQIRIGETHTWLKNIKAGEAVGVFPASPEYKLVPEVKTGDPVFDSTPAASDAYCAIKFGPNAKAFPLNGGQEVYTTSDGAGIGPVPRSWSKKMPNDEPSFQLVALFCTYYFDQTGSQHATCATYRLKVGEGYAFKCSQSPISGKFERELFGFCET